MSENELVERQQMDSGVCVCVYSGCRMGEGGEERINHGLFGFHRIGHYPPVLFMLKDCLIG